MGVSLLCYRRRHVERILIDSCDTGHRSIINWGHHSRGLCGPFMPPQNHFVKGEGRTPETRQAPEICIHTRAQPFRPNRGASVLSNPAPLNPFHSL